MAYRLRLFGPPSLTDESGGTPSGLGPGKPLAVICYLAREGEVRRETVTALLWGETSESKARNAFRQALHRLRSALGQEMVPHDPDTVRIAGGADLWVDAEEFERALAEGRPEDAVELVDGDFLEGFAVGEPGFDHWADRERARLRGRFLGALREAAENAMAQGRLDEAVLHARRLAEEDPLDSAAAVLEAKTLTAAGRVGEARRLLVEHADRYRGELGDEPPDEVATALAGLESPREAEEEALTGVVEPTLRPEALRSLLGEWRTAVGGDATVVLLEGERGAGKTWLVDELTRRIRPLDRPIVLRGAERMGRHGLPYAPVAEALRGVLRARGLAGASTHLLAEAARLLPELRDRFDLPLPPPIDDQTGRLRFYEGVASVLDAVAFEQPVLLILEGLEDADEPTLELVQFLTSRLGDASILFVLSCETGRDRALADRLGGRAERVELGRLESSRIEELVEVRLPGLGPMARADIAAASDGSPGRALDLGQRLLRGEPIAGPPAPVEDILRSRLVACSPRERRILLVLALIGRPLPVRLVAAATHLPEGAVLESVPGLRSVALLREREDGIGLPEGPTGRLVLESAGSAGRGLLAGWAMEALVAERAATDAELAGLAAEAGRVAEAARYAEAAGRTAARVGAHDLARDHLRRALELTEDPGSRARLERLLAGLGAGGLRIGPGSEGESHVGWEGLEGSSFGSSSTESSRDGAPGSTGEVGSPSGWTGTRSRLGILVGALGAVLVLVVLGVVQLPDFMTGAGPIASDRVVRDTLVLVRTDPGGGQTRLAFTGDPETALDRRPPVLAIEEVPRWVETLRSAGLPALVSPTGQRVAVEGEDGGVRRLLVVSPDRSDTVRLDSGPYRFDPLGWGPEGDRLLYARTPAGGVRRRLWAVRVTTPVPIPVDTTGRDVEEAVWSPDGTRIAWTARSQGATGRAVWVSFADGSEARRLTDDTTDDYHLVWAPGGERVAFTSDRTGDAEIHAVEVRSGRLWRLTWEEAHDDRPAFSPDGEYLAFESTRGGEAAVYVVSSWGGQPQRVTAPGQRVRHQGWRGYPPPHLSHLRFQVPEALGVGDRGELVVDPVYNDYVSRHSGFIQWRALDPSIVGLAPEEEEERPVSASQASTGVVGRRPGLGRIAVSAGGWREDTVLIKVGDEPMVVREPDRAGGYPLAYGLRVEGRMVARGGSAGGEAGTVRVGLVAPEVAGESGDRVPVASLSWLPGEGRVTFQVEREEHSEALAAVAEGSGAPRALEFAFVVGKDGHVAFEVDGEVRWRSTLRVTGVGLPLHRVRLDAPGDGSGEGDVEALMVTVGPSLDETG